MLKQLSQTVNRRPSTSLEQSGTKRATHSKVNTSHRDQNKTAMKHTVGQRSVCTCRTSLLPLCRLIPRQTFGNSYFTGPSIILLRLIFPASSFQLNCRHNKRSGRSVLKVSKALTVSQRFSESVLKPRRLAREQRENIFSHWDRKVSTSDFLEEVAASTAKYATYQVTSISWVKALASHMSHEFIQFVIEDSVTGQRLRLITDRQETGDWVITTASDIGVASTPSSSWSDFSPYKDRHNLPLPLISIRFDEHTSRPSLMDMARLMAEISEAAPGYNPLREHCWWYAESIFEAVRSRYDASSLREWPWAKYRYSFVLCNGWVRRKRLAEEASEFERMCLSEMVY